MRGAAECASTTPCSRETSDCLRVGNHFPELGSPLPASSPTKLNDSKPNPKPVRRGRAAGTCEIKRAILSENGAMVQKGLAIRRLAIAKQCTVLPALKGFKVRAVQANASGRQRSQAHIDKAHTVDELQGLLSVLKTRSEPLPDIATLFRVLQQNSRC